MGQEIYAYNESTGKNERHPLLEIISHGVKNQEVTYLSLRDDETLRYELIVTTPGHPFYLEKNVDNSDRPAPKGHEDLSEPWVGAGDLKLGDKVRQADGTAGTVRIVKTTQQERSMYNLDVANLDNFYVGEQGWLVHNANCPTKILTEFSKKGVEKTELLFKNRNDALNWARQNLGHDTDRIYDASGQWIGWENKVGDSVYWDHGDWGKLYDGLPGKSTYPHLNYDINGVRGHLYLEDKIRNTGSWDSFTTYFGIGGN